MQVLLKQAIPAAGRLSALSALLPESCAMALFDSRSLCCSREAQPSSLSLYSPGRSACPWPGGYAPPPCRCRGRHSRVLSRLTAACRGIEPATSAGQTGPVIPRCCRRRPTSSRVVSPGTRRSSAETWESSVYGVNTFPINWRWAQHTSTCRMGLRHPRHTAPHQRQMVCLRHPAFRAVPGSHPRSR